MIILNSGQQFVYHDNGKEIIVSFVCMEGDNYIFSTDAGDQLSFNRYDFYEKILTPYSGGLQTTTSSETIVSEGKGNYSVKKFERADQYERNVSGKPAYKTDDEVQFNGNFTPSDNKVVKRGQSSSDDTDNKEEKPEPHKTVKAEYDPKYLKLTSSENLSDKLYKKITRTGKGEVTINVKGLTLSERDEVINFVLENSSKNLKTIRVKHGVKWAFLDAYGVYGESTGKIIEQKMLVEGIMIYQLDQKKNFEKIETEIARDDLSIKCQKCGKPFVFSVGEQKFFAERDYKTPKRCEKCRKQPQVDTSFIEKELGLKSSSFFERYSGSERPVGEGLTAEYEHYDSVQKEIYKARRKGRR